MNTLFKTVTNSDDQKVVPLSEALIQQQSILIEGLELMVSIGVLGEEKTAPQRVIIDADIQVQPTINNQQDDINSVLSYASIVEDVQSITASGHIELVETLAQKIIEKVSAYPQAQSIVLSVKKPDIIEQAGAVGILVEADFSCLLYTSPSPRDS